jgi:hypothetical protein
MSRGSSEKDTEEGRDKTKQNWIYKTKYMREEEGEKSQEVIYQTARNRVQDDSNLYSYLHENLKSRIIGHILL